MGVLRSLSALQMYQRATRSPIDGPPSLDSCCSTSVPALRHVLPADVADSVSRLPRGHRLAPVLSDAFETAAQASGDALDGAELDAETELAATARSTK